MWITKPSLPATSTNLSKFTSYPCSLCFGHTGHIRYSKHAPVSGPLHLPVPSACNALHPDILMAGTLISFRCLTKCQLIREDTCNYSIWNRNSFRPYHLKNTLNCAWFFHRILSHSLFPEKFWLFCGNDHHQTLVAKHNKNVSDSCNTSTADQQGAPLVVITQGLRVMRLHVSCCFHNDHSSGKGMW